MLLEFVAQSSQSEVLGPANTERLVNLFPEPVPEGGRARFLLRPVLAMQQWRALSGIFVRALEAVNDTDGSGNVTEALFAVSGGQLHEVSDPPQALGAVVDDPQTTIAGHDGAVTVVAGGRYYLWDGATLTEPTPGAFSDFGSVEFLGGYTILTERGGRRFQWSALGDPDDLPGLNFATAESRDDALLRAVAVNGNLWLFKTGSIEIWARTGEASEEAFSLLPGGVIETGLLGFGLIAKVPGGAFFVGSDGVCYLTAGAQLQPVSRTPVEYAIAAEAPTHCFYYEHEGHKFCVVRFRNRPAWVLDIATGMWHERASGEGAWLATSAVRYAGAWRVGLDGGRVDTLVRAGSDADGPLVRQAVSRTLFLTGERFRVSRVELFGRIGRSDLGRPAQLMVQFSRDGGETWGFEQWRSMGDLGAYEARMVLRALGQCRSLTARLRVTDPADLSLWSAAAVEVA